MTRHRNRINSRWGTTIITPPSSQPDYFQRFMDTRKGAGAHTLDDFGIAYTSNVLTVTTLVDNGSNTNPTPGSLRAALRTTGPKWIKFSPTIPAGDIIPTNRLNLPFTSDTILDGYQWGGSIKAPLNGGGGVANIAVMFITAHEPFAYGASPSNNQVISLGNTRHAYLRWCTFSGGGDALLASGAYNPQNYPAPYCFTAEECLFGPSPDEYTLMSPLPFNVDKVGVFKGDWTPNTVWAKNDIVNGPDGRRWITVAAVGPQPTFRPGIDWLMPGLWNGADNDARNGKLVNSGLDHQYLKAHPTEADLYTNACRSTLVNSLLQGGVVRGPKASFETMDVVGIAMVKYGNPYRVFGTGGSSNIGGGLAGEGKFVMNVEGCTWVPKVEGEQMFAFPHARADALNVPRTTVDAEGAVSQAIAYNLPGEGPGNMYVSPNNYLPNGMTYAQAVSAGLADTFPQTTGFDRTAPVTINGITLPGYTLTIPDVSTYQKAEAHLAELEATCGNPYSTSKPRYWRETHTGGPGQFPNTVVIPEPPPVVVDPAAPVFVAAAASPATTSVSSITVPYPDGMQLGDIMLLEHVLNSGGTETPPAGFTEIGRQDDTTNALRSILYKRTCDGSEPATLTLTSTLVNRMVGVIAAYRNVTGVSAYAAAAEPVSTVAHDVPAVTYPGNAVIVTFTSERGSNGTTTATEPVGTTKRAEFGTSGNGGVFAAVADQLTPAAAGVDLSAWAHAVASATAVTWAVALSPGVSTPPPVFAKFGGDPGTGKFTVGAALGSKHFSVASLLTNPSYQGHAVSSVLHDYSDNTGGVKATKLDNAINIGLIPSQSFKFKISSNPDVYKWTTDDILAGLADADIDTSAAACAARAPWPIWLTYFHEADGYFASGAPAAAYRQAFRYIVMRFRTAGVTNVSWMPVYMNPWTFRSFRGPSPTTNKTDGSQSGRDWREFHPDWNAAGTGWYDDLTMDMFGADTYDPLPGSSTPETFGGMWDQLRQQVERPGYPVWDYVQPEFGIGSQVSPQPDWQAWMTDAIAYAKAHRIKNFVYWDQDPVTHWWSLGSTQSAPVTDPSNLRLNAWQQVVAASVKNVAPLASTVTVNGDGTTTISGATVRANLDGTFTITDAVANGDGTYTIGA